MTYRQDKKIRERKQTGGQQKTDWKIRFELMIPGLSPIPGMKLGLANIITVYAVYRYRAGEILMVVIARILLGSVFSGRFMALAYSLAGGLFCLSGMLVLRHFISEKYIWMCSVLGAILHNLGQVTIAVLITGSPAPAVYFPLLMVTGCVAGLFTGLCARMMIYRKDMMKTMNI